MKRTNAVILVFSMLAAILSAAQVQASQDITQPWRSIEAHFVSAGFDDTGPISVTAKTDRDKWLSVEIEAYGKKFQLSDKQLATLKGFPLTSLHVNYGDNSMLLGEGEKAEHFVYVEVEKTRTEEKSEITTSVTMAISKSKGLEVDEPSTVVTIPN